MTDDLQTAVRTMLARVGREPDELLGRRETADLLTACGFRMSPGTLAKYACTMPDAIPYTTAFGRCLYRAGDAILFALGQRQAPKDSPQARTAQLRRDRGDVLGRKRGEARSRGAAAA